MTGITTLMLFAAIFSINCFVHSSEATGAINSLEQEDIAAVVALYAQDNFDLDAFDIDPLEALPQATTSHPIHSIQATQKLTEYREKRITLLPPQPVSMRVALACPHCKEICSSQKALEKHEFICGKPVNNTRRKALVEQHQAVMHHNHYDAPTIKSTLFICPHCPQQCLSQHNLDQHLKVHAADTISARCSECGIHLSTWKNSHQRHTAQHPHQAVTWTFWQNGIEVPTETILNSLAPKEYTCPHCPQQCLSQHNLDQHLKVHAANTISARCSECGIHLSTWKNNYKIHTDLHPRQAVTWTFWQNGIEVPAEEVLRLQST